MRSLRAKPRVGVAPKSSHLFFPLASYLSPWLCLPHPRHAPPRVFLGATQSPPRPREIRRQIAAYLIANSIATGIMTRSLSRRSESARFLP
jgi:hypothetical protein